ncbi:MAG: hypothetical protein A2X88_07805 [Deltaproteobacteria bacterium GWC2_65_14]|nr:MAG: hypothetical protein A2X88_07805 [Deltaproteobacteria bacterium GWC2_65_14]
MASRGFRHRRIGAFASAALFLLSCSREPPRITDADVVVAKVNGAPVTLQELKAEIASIQGLSPSAVSKGTAPEVSQALRRLVERSMVLQEGVRQGISVTESELEEEVKRYRSDFPPGGLEKTLLQQGIGMDEWRSRMRQSLLYRKSAEAVAGRLAEVTEEEVRRAWRERPRRTSPPEQILVRQLMFDTEESALRVRERILAGDSPDKAVLKGSGEGPAPAIADLGYLSREDLPRELSGELFALPAGGASRVVRRDKSVSIFLVEGRRESREESFEEAAPQIREELLRAKREEGFRGWMEGEMARADVKIQEAILAELTEGKR